jgi:hypothetical protein
VTGITSAPSSFIRNTLGFCRSTSVRAHIDDAFQAELGADRGGGHAVLAGAGLGDDPVLPMRRASRIWPSTLLILCAPVWFSSSRFM